MGENRVRRCHGDPGQDLSQNLGKHCIIIDPLKIDKFSIRADVSYLVFRCPGNPDQDLRGNICIVIEPSEVYKVSIQCFDKTIP